MLLRQCGPLWLSDDERSGRLFSLRPLIVTGINGSARRVTLEAIDPATGRHVAVTLEKVYKRLGKRVQVVHLQQSVPNPSSTAPAAVGAAPVAPVPTVPVAAAPPAVAAPTAALAAVAPVVAAQAYYSRAMNPAAGVAAAGLVVSATGLTYTIFKDIVGIGAGPDIVYRLGKLDGKVFPRDDRTFDQRGAWRHQRLTYPGPTITNLGRRRAGAAVVHRL
jgi:hypothetical protein